MLRAALRERTRESHERLEARLDLLAPGFSTEQYLCLLTRFYGFHLPLEPRLASPDWRIQEFDYESRRKVPLLLSDLRYLGLSEAALTRLPACGKQPPVDTLARRLGCLYVLEGSTLGGQLLARHFRARFGYTAKKGCAFFSGYGKRTASMWQRFIAFLESQNFGKTDRAEALDSADVTFRALERWLLEEGEQAPVTRSPLIAS